MKIKENIKYFIAENSSFLFSAPAVLWQVLFLYMPFFLVVYTSLKQTMSSSSFDLTLNNYYTVLTSQYFCIIARSAVVALIVTVLCFICAYPVAYFLALRVSKRWRNILLFLLTLPFWTNFLIQIYSWLFILDHNGLINKALLKLGIIQEPLHMVNNIGTILLVMVYYYLPFMVMPLYSILEKIQHDVLEASMDLGATYWQTFKRITLPLSMSGIKTGAFLVFVPVFGEFVIPSIVGGGHHMFVGSLVSHYFLMVRDSQLGAAFTIVSGLVLLLCALLFDWLCETPSLKMHKELE